MSRQLPPTRHLPHRQAKHAARGQSVARLLPSEGFFLGAHGEQGWVEEGVVQLDLARPGLDTVEIGEGPGEADLSHSWGCWAVS